MMETNIFVPWCYKKIEEQQREELIEKFKVEIEEELKAQQGSLLFGLIKKDWKKYMYKGGPPEDEDDHYIQYTGFTKHADPKKYD